MKLLMKKLPPPPKPAREERHARPVPKPRAVPPLFIKIDKYRDVVEGIARLKSHALSLRDALDSLGEVEKEMQAALVVTQRALDRFNTLIAEMDAKMVKIPGFDQREVPPVEGVEELDDVARRLYSQVEKMRGELKRVAVE